MNTPVPAGLSSYPTVSGQRYRLYGVARSIPVPPGQADPAQNALIAAGLTSLTYYTDPATLPTDWPSATAVPVSVDEHVFYADGTWSIGSPMPTSITVGSGMLIIYDVWSYAPDTNVNVQSTSLTTSSSSSSTSTGAYVAVGLLALAAGFAATLLMLPKHAHANPVGTSRSFVEMYGQTKIYLNYNASTRTWRATSIGMPGYFEAAGYEAAYSRMVTYLKTLPGASANPIDRYEVRVGSSVKLETADFRKAHASYSHWVRDAERRNGNSQEVTLLGNGKVLASFSLHSARENPVRYSTSFVYRDVQVHVHENSGTFCADYSSIDMFVPGAGGQVCADKQSAAITTSKRKIDAILERLPETNYPTPQRAPILSPWD